MVLSSEYSTQAYLTQLACSWEIFKNRVFQKHFEI